MIYLSARLFGEQANYFSSEIVRINYITYTGTRLGRFKYRRILIFLSSPLQSLCVL